MEVFIDMAIDRTGRENLVPRKKVPNSRVIYEPPFDSTMFSLTELLDVGRRSLTNQQKTLFSNLDDADVRVFTAGNVQLLEMPCISVIGARNVSQEGVARTSKISTALSRAGVVVVSGLAKGVDAAAHNSALRAGGKTIGVIGTPLDTAYPAENSGLQEEIYRNHLLLSQFPVGQRTFQSDFPKRNRLMAAVSDGSVIVEASDTSGTLHQAAECVRLGRWLFIMKSVVDNPKLKWPARFLSHPKTVILTDVQDVLSRLD
jgi:DNA processing protein